MIKVIAKNFVKEDKVEEVLDLVKKLVKATRKEEGCIEYDMYQDVKNPNHLVMVEEWETMEALNNHMASEHFKKIIPQMNAFMAQESELNICKKVI